MFFLSTILVDFAQTQSEAFFCVDLTGLPNTVEEVSQAQDSDSRLKSKRMKRPDLHHVLGHVAMYRGEVFQDFFAV